MFFNLLMSLRLITKEIVKVCSKKEKWNISLLCVLTMSLAVNSLTFKFLISSINFEVESWTVFSGVERSFLLCFSPIFTYKMESKIQGNTNGTPIPWYSKKSDLCWTEWQYFLAVTKILSTCEKLSNEILCPTQTLGFKRLFRSCGDLIFKDFIVVLLFFKKT